MKKNNLITFFFLCLTVIAALVLTACGAGCNKPVSEFDGTGGATSSKAESSSLNQSTESTASEQAIPQKAESAPQPVESKPVNSSKTEETKPIQSTPVSEPESTVSSQPSSKPETEEKLSDMANSLFIGDSRTVGLMEYAGIKNANFFCSTGMSVFNIDKERISVPGVGKVTFNELLSAKKYAKIYIMLGINELGYSQKSVVSKYNSLLDRISSSQPEAVIFIQANLHVSEKRSRTDKVINNPAINSINAQLAEAANGNSRLYLDANPLFDDKNGNLSADKTQDNAHLYARYYAEWGDWICKKTFEMLGE